MAYLNSRASLQLFVDNIGSGLSMPVQLEISRAPGEPDAYVSKFDSRVVSYCVIEKGNGYISPPTISVDGNAEAEIVLVGGVEEILFKPSGFITTTTPTPTINITPSPSLSRTPTATPTITKSVSITPTSTTTLTLSTTKTVTPTHTPTTTATPTITRTQTLTPSISPTHTSSSAIFNINNFSNLNFDNNNTIFTNQNIELSPGSGFRAPPNIVFEGIGFKAETTTEIVGGIESVDIAMAGEGYQVAPLILVDGDGYGAKLEAKISGYIYRTFISDAGLYTNGTTLNITADSGNATFSGVMSTPDPYTGLISLIEVAITNPGSGYHKAPNINISSPNNNTSRQARAYCSINAGISSINIKSSGYGYTKPPKLSIVRIQPSETEIYKPNDQARFVKITPTPTQTSTPTQTQTPSYSPTITCTPTTSVTRTTTPTQSLTLTPSISSSPTPSITPSDYTNLVISSTGSIGPTPTSSRTATPTKSITPSPTVTKTKTPTITPTPTKTTTPTNTVTKTSSPTLTPTSTVTPTRSQTPTITPSPTIKHPDIISYDAILIPRMSYSISKINIIDPGRYRYPNKPELKAQPAYTAEYKAIIDDAGNGFEFTPTVKIIGSTISSAFRVRKDPVCLPIINYKIGSVEILDAGDGYTIPPKIVLNGGYDPIKGTKAQLIAQVNNGRVQSINISNSGNFYRSYPDIKIFAQNDTGYGLKIKLKLIGSLEDVYITEIGHNLTPGSPNNQIIFEGGGSGVTNPRAHVVLNNTAGSGFYGIANVNYHVDHVKITDPGSDYDFSPAVRLSGGEQRVFNDINPKPAIIQSRIEGVVKEITITDPGSDFTRCPSPIVPEILMVGSKPIPGFVSAVFNNSREEWYNRARKKLKTGTFDVLTGNTSLSARVIPSLHDWGEWNPNNTISLFDSGTCIYPNTLRLTLDVVSDFPYNLPFELIRDLDYQIVSDPSSCCNVQISPLTTNPGLVSLFAEALGVASSGDLFKDSPEFLFYEKPHLLFYNSYDLSSKTYLNFAGYSASYKDTTSVSNTGYLNTNKTPSTHVGDYSQEFFLTLNSISSPDYDRYSNSYGVNIEGKIKGFSELYYETGSFDNAQKWIKMSGFFDTLPSFYIEDEVGEDTTVSMTKFSNNFTRLVHYKTGYQPNDNYINNSTDDWYTLDNIIGPNVLKTNLRISDGGSNYTSRAILVCSGAGVPTSWNNPPIFNISVNSGSISNITINNGGAGFAESILPWNRHHIYFSGGGGSGASGILLTSWNTVSNFYQQANPYNTNASITGILLLNSGTGYTSAPTPIIIDGSPTWNNIEYNNKLINKNNNNYTQVGVFPLVDFYYKDSVIAGCPRPTPEQKHQISQGFISEETRVFAAHRIHKHYIDGVLDDALVGYILPPGPRPPVISYGLEYQRWTLGAAQPSTYNTSPYITIANADSITNAGSILPEIRAEIPRWQTVYSDTILLKQEGPIE